MSDELPEEMATSNGLTALCRAILNNFCLSHAFDIWHKFLRDNFHPAIEDPDSETEMFRCPTETVIEDAIWKDFGISDIQAFLSPQITALEYGNPYTIPEYGRAFLSTQITTLEQSKPRDGTISGDDFDRKGFLYLMGILKTRKISIERFITARDKVHKALVETKAVEDKEL
ncbi:hypothetical protein B0H13DRAFT_1915580 [Mycena leptocephala]|nr:hypothetical protein B0H13DRAFT_1915580 [Mycena leptocephala]